MRRLTRLSILVPALIVISSSLSFPKVATYPSDNEADKKLFDWCMSYFPAEDGHVIHLPRPVEKFEPFNIKEFATPPDLVSETRVVGELPLAIEKYKGQWMLPSIGSPPLSALFVEQLTPTEMTVAIIPGPFISKQWNNKAEEALRPKLKWKGKYFSTEPDDSEGVRLNIFVSEDGQAMSIIMVGDREAWPLGCLISSKYY